MKFNSLDLTEKPSILMVVKGEGGVGKTTSAATAPHFHLQLSLTTARTRINNISDFRGIAADVALIENGTICRSYADHHWTTTIR